MGQKVSPHGFRLGINKDWNSTWFPANKADMAAYILEDDKIRKLLDTKYAACSISKILIERRDARIVVNIYTGRAGLLIGQKGAGIEQLKKEISKMVGQKKVDINIKEVKNIDADAALVAQSVAQQLEKRASWRRAMKSALQRAMKAGVKGCKIMIGGRLDGADIARSEFYQEGILPLHTLRSDIDFGFAEAHTTFGIIGVKCWVCHGELLGKKRRETTVSRGERKPFNNKNGNGERRPYNNDRKPNNFNRNRSNFNANKEGGNK